MNLYIELKQCNKLSESMNTYFVLTQEFEYKFTNFDDARFGTRVGDGRVKIYWVPCWGRRLFRNITKRRVKFMGYPGPSTEGAKTIFEKIEAKTFFSGTGQNLWGTRAGTIDRGRRLLFRKNRGGDFFSKKKLGVQDIFSKKIRGAKTFFN